MQRKIIFNTSVRGSDPRNAALYWFCRSVWTWPGSGILGYLSRRSCAAAWYMAWGGKERIIRLSRRAIKYLGLELRIPRRPCQKWDLTVCRRGPANSTVSIWAEARLEVPFWIGWDPCKFPSSRRGLTSEQVVGKSKGCAIDGLLNLSVRVSGFIVLRITKKKLAQSTIIRRWQGVVNREAFKSF